MLRDPRWVAGLMAFDREIADEVRAAGCPCGGQLHCGNFPRKPRGLPPGFDASVLSHRLDFCCDRDGCRQRRMPPSVIWLGRRVYVSVAVLLGAALRNGDTPERVRRVCELTGASARTLRRWVLWWREVFTTTATWRVLGPRVTMRAPECDLPLALLNVSSTEDPVQTLTRVLTWLLPLTSRTGPPLGSRFAMLF